MQRPGIRRGPWSYAVTVTAMGLHRVDNELKRCKSWFYCSKEKLVPFKSNKRVHQLLKKTLVLYKTSVILAGP